MNSEKIKHGNNEPVPDEPANMKVTLSSTISEIKKIFRDFLHLDCTFGDKLPVYGIFIHLLLS